MIRTPLGRRGFLASLLALPAIALPAIARPAGLPSPGPLPGLPAARPGFRLVNGWILTDRDVDAIAALRRDA